jgi:threonine/homoserine/homoserine lactone efflux protein
VSAAEIFVATALNPKVLIFAFAIFPRAGLYSTATLMLLLAMMASLCGAGWIALGRMVADSAGRLATEGRIARSAAVVLGLFATIMAGSAVAAAAA